MGKADREVLEQRIAEGIEKEKEETKRQRKKRLKKESKEFQTGFKKFVTRGDVMELAIALAISTAFNRIVNGIVEWVLTPLISLMTSGISMSDWRYILSHATEEKSEIAIKYGALIEVTLDFFLIALMLYIIIRVLTRIRNRFHQSEIERAKAEDPANCMFMNCSAEILGYFIKPHTIERIFLNFSCPYPKSTYKNRRLTYYRFLDIYKQLLKENGEIHFKTDDKDFFSFSVQSFSENGFIIKNVSLDLNEKNFPENIVTEYEAMFREIGKPIYRLEAHLA